MAYYNDDINPFRSVIELESEAVANQFAPIEVLAGITTPNIGPAISEVYKGWQSSRGFPEKKSETPAISARPDFAVSHEPFTGTSAIPTRSPSVSTKDFPAETVVSPTSTSSASRTLLLPNNEGYINLSPDWNAAEEGRKFQANFGNYPTSINAIRAQEEALSPKQDIVAGAPGSSRIATFKGGIPSRSDVERAQWGGMEPPEKKAFDFNEFSSVVNKIGSNVPIPMKAKIFEQMMKGIDEHNTRVDEFTKLRMQVGAGSPQMITAQSGAIERATKNRIELAKTGPEIQKIMAETGKALAETSGIPVRNEHEAALAGYYRSITDNPKYKHLKDTADVYMKAYQNPMLPPDERDRILQRAVNVLSTGMADANNGKQVPLTWEQFRNIAKQKGSKMSETELKKAYNERVGVAE